MIGVYQKEGDGNSATHILAARYSYDPYGNPTSMTNGAGTAVSQTSNTIAAINPFRYRGYRYDGDTGLYYLQSLTVLLLGEHMVCPWYFIICGGGRLKLRPFVWMCLYCCWASISWEGCLV